VNLGLEVLGKRPDGYHELVTVTQTISVADRVIVETAAEGIALEVTGSWQVPADSRNIAWQAAERFLSAAELGGGVRIQLHKEIPPMSGLGGGSSDCVATLIGLGRLFPGSDAALTWQIAVGLGSDTALFIEGGAALCSGRGEQVKRLGTLTDACLVIARPAVGVSTQQAYAWLTPDDFGDGHRTLGLADAILTSSQAMAGGLVMANSFQRPVTEHVPAIAQLLSEMGAAGVAHATLTGSGSAAFGLVPDYATAESAAGRLASQGYWARSAQTTGGGWTIVTEPPQGA
jgi:4-diphosphocytidyl-2-C-methyl-D-erythritol kinase